MGRRCYILIQILDLISLGLGDLRWLWECSLFLSKTSPALSQLSLGQDVCSLGKPPGIGTLGSVCVCMLQCKLAHTHTTDYYFAAHFAHQQLPSEARLWESHLNAIGKDEVFGLERTVTCYVCFFKKYGLQRTEWLWSADTWFLLPSNSWKKNEKMSQTSFLKLYFPPSSVYIQLHPKQAAPRSQTLPKHIGFPSPITTSGSYRKGWKD